MKFAWIAALTLVCTTSFAQRLKITPEQPSVTDSIFIEYNSEFFADNTPIQCRVYYAGIGTTERDFPRVRLIPLIKNGNFWKGVIRSVPPQATAMVITFTDSLGQRDTNNRSGYWSLLYRNGKPLPGGWAGAGDLLYGQWVTENCLFHLGDNPDSAQVYYNKEGTMDQLVERAYMRQYLLSFKTGTAESDQKLKDKLTYFSALPFLSELNLQTLRQQYLRLNDILNANRCEQEIFARFPEGSWTPQVKSLPLDMKAGTSRNFTDQVKAYQDFKKSFLKPYQDESAIFFMNYRAARMLSYMVNHFSTEGTMELWKKEVSFLTDAGRFAAYRQGSEKLLTKYDSKAKTSQAQIENTFYQFNLDPDHKLKDAEDLALMAIALWNENVENLFRQNEAPSLTQEEIIQSRVNRLSSVMALLGSSLLKQNRIPEAVTVLKESVDRNHFIEPETNELYMEALVKSGNLDLALAESQKIIALNKSTEMIDTFYSKAQKSQNTLNTLKEEALEKTKTRMMQRLTKEKCPDFTAYDNSGKSITSKAFKNKIVVITFWASWCPPCMAELRSMDLVVKKFEHDPEVVFISVNEDDSRERALKIINQLGAKNHFAFDQKRKMIYAFGAVLPTQVILDKTGEIRFRMSGLSTFNEQENSAALEALISILKTKE